MGCSNYDSLLTSITNHFLFYLSYFGLLANDIFSPVLSFLSKRYPCDKQNQNL
jgi:hypothetical protein